jgi:SAM-dependent methyltransferase
VPRVTKLEAERYWDERARENAFYFVDNEIDYRDPDDEVFWRRGVEVLDKMLEMVGLEIGSDETVVDIGCGVGRMTRALAARVRYVYGIDVSSEMLARAQEHNAHVTNVEWLHGDGRGLGVVGTAAADGCFSHVVFQHIPEPEITLDYVREMGRVLRPGGWALFQVSTNPDVHRPRGGVRSRLKGRMRAGSRAQRDAAWWGSAVDIAALRRAAAEGGLEIEQLLGEGSQFTTVLARRR